MLIVTSDVTTEVARSAKNWYNKKKGKKGAQVKPGQYYILIFLIELARILENLIELLNMLCKELIFLESQVKADMSSILATITIIIMRILHF